MSVVAVPPESVLTPEILEKLSQGDLSKLSPTQRVQYYAMLCDRLGIDPAFQPFGWMVLSNKLCLYALKNCTDQLRKRHAVSIDPDMHAAEYHDIYVVTATARLPSGRTDVSTGAVSLGNKKGDELANALMKAETKAKRRVTLSIVGLGMLDESEVEAIPEARIIPTSEAETIILPPEEAPPPPPPAKERKPHRKVDDGRRARIFSLIEKYAHVNPEGAKILQDTETRHAIYEKLFRKHRLDDLTEKQVDTLANMIQKRIDEETPQAAPAEPDDA